jgi:HPt (histidine-containing phosphotransfer) domain-containing protein
LAQDAQQALSQIAGHPIDVVVVDSLLADRNGAELIREIRKAGGGEPRMKLIALADDLAGRDDCLSAGADACLSRPLRVAEFHQTVCTIPTPSGAPSGAPAEPKDRADSIDWQVALEAVGGRRDFLPELVELFEAEYPPTLGVIRAAIADRDPKKLQISAHKLKGCLRYFGPTAAGELARSLEEIGRAGTVDGAANLVEPLYEAVERILPLLRQGP